MSDKTKDAADSESVARVLSEAEKERFQKRLEFGIKALSQEDFQILFNNEFVEQLPKCLYDMLGEEDDDTIFTVLSHLEKAASNKKHQIRERTITILSLFFNLLVRSNNDKFIQIVARILTDWLRSETEYSPSYETVCSQLLLWSKVMFRQEQYDGVDYLFMTIHQIDNRKVHTSVALVNTIRRMQKQFATDEVIDELMEKSLDDQHPSFRIAKNLLAHMGPAITDYLVDKLLLCDDKQLRFKLIEMITARGTSIGSQLVQRLKKNSPWYFIRNIIMMMSMIDDDSLLPNIKLFLTYEDTRVQKEAIRYINKQGKEHKVQHMVDALFLVNDELKTKIIMQLGNIGGDEVTEAFIDLIAARNNLSELYGDEVLVSSCIGLENATSERVVIQLSEIIEERTDRFGKLDRVVIAAQSTLNKIEPRIRHEGKQSKIDSVESLEHDESEISFSSGYDLEALEERVERLLQEEQHAIVEEMLYDQALLALSEKDFKTVEYLRERILQVNPKALSKAIELSNMIDRQEDVSIELTLNKDDEMWSDLKKLFTQAEFDLFYNLLKQQQYETDELIVEQGNYDPSLFFIQSGTVNLTCLCGDYERFLKRMRKGDIIGSQSFFDASVWSVSLVAQKNVRVFYLQYKQFEQLVAHNPNLEKKLQDYCSQRENISELLKMSGEERRQAPRFSLQAIINNTLLDRFGQVGRRDFKGEIRGISTGGLRCLIRIDKREQRQSLLGRMIVSEIANGESSSLKCKGTILGVKEQAGMDKYFTIHVRFEKPLSQPDVTTIVSHNKARPEVH